jgi:hypothetical protein
MIKKEMEIDKGFIPIITFSIADNEALLIPKFLILILYNNNTNNNNRINKYLTKKTFSLLGPMVFDFQLLKKLNIFHIWSDQTRLQVFFLFD